MYLTEEKGLEPKSLVITYIFFSVTRVYSIAFSSSTQTNNVSNSPFPPPQHMLVDLPKVCLDKSSKGHIPTD